MRSIVNRALVNRTLSFGALAGILLAAGCGSNQGTGLLSLSISADPQIPDEAASGSARLSVALYDLKGRLAAYEYKGTTIGKNQEVSLDFNGSRVVPGVYCISVRYGSRNFYGRLGVR